MSPTLNSPKRDKATSTAQLSPADMAPSHLRILHLGFEDPKMPGAGGGSVRTHEINKRLAAAGHRVSVLTTGYPGAEERWQDGVHYVPLSMGRGRTRVSRLLGYVLRQPWEVYRRRHNHDLVVEDFFAPFSTMAAPLWTKKPTLGMVQWLHAKDKSRQYKLPFQVLERFGVKTHRRLIAVSNGTASSIQRLNPQAHVDVIGNGLDPRALETPARLGRDIVFIGRLEVPHKGIDLLLQSWKIASAEIDGDLIMVGSGPDEQRVKRMVEEFGVQDRVRFTGWMAGEEKYRILASARLAVIPSRHETFGLVAIEALATCTPVIAFDIPCLREVVPEGSGWLVEAFDAEALADEIVQRYNEPEEILLRAGQQGRRFAARFDWDSLASEQATVYQAALESLRTER